MIVSVEAGVFFCDDGDGCAGSRTGGAPHGWQTRAQAAIARSRAEGGGEGKSAGCKEGIGPAMATGAGEAVDPGKVAAL